MQLECLFITKDKQALICFSRKVCVNMPAQKPLFLALAYIRFFTVLECFNLREFKIVSLSSSSYHVYES